MSSAKGLIVAATASGCGKTTVTLGLLRHLAASGRKVASAKAGPDYIDPAFHAAATSAPCLNLDSWAMRPETLGAAAAGLAAGGLAAGGPAAGGPGAATETVICEGVMGLFDGAFTGPGEDDGSTADLARLTGWPVVLVIDARAQAASAAAVLKGFHGFRPGVDIAGVVFNRVGGERHGEILRRACADAVPGVPVLGCLPRTDGLALPERHLGLVQAGEHPDLEGFLENARALIAEHLDVEGLLALARPLGLGGPLGDGPTPPLAPLGQRIAVAADDAFAFSYPLMIEGWRRAGAEIAPFSPLADGGPDDGADAVYLPGGYPELHAGTLAAAGGFQGGLRRAAARGAAVYGECGGYMVLGNGLIDAAGNRHPMAGLLALETSFEEPKLHLGYRRAATLESSPLGGAGAAFRGHEFHYTGVIGEGPGQALFRAADAEGRDLGNAGLMDGTVAGSFIHLIDREGD